jgi:hypothetical protein
MSTITAAQSSYIQVLNAQLRELGTDWFIALSDEVSTREASETITQLKTWVAEARARSARVTSTTELVAEGIYRRSADGVMFRVQTSEQGRRYAKTLLTTGGWDYERGAIFTLAASERLTLAEVKAWGLDTGVCAVCGRLLSTADSVAAGIGPVCAKRY